MERTFIIPERVAVTSVLHDFPPWLSCESSLRTHWTMNSFWKLKPLIDDDGGISPAGLIYPGIWVCRENRSRDRETQLLPAADYHPGMFIKSYDSFRQLLSFFRLKVRLSIGDRASFIFLSTSYTYMYTYIYKIDIYKISFTSFHKSSDNLTSTNFIIFA